MFPLFDSRITGELPCPAEGDMGRGGEENIGKATPDTEMAGEEGPCCLQSPTSVHTAVFRDMEGRSLLETPQIDLLLKDI